MAIARVAGPHAASEVRIHPLRRSAPLSAPSAPPCCSAAHLSHLRLVALPQRSTEETREQKRSRAVGGMLRGVKHAHEHVVESLEVADPVRLHQPPESKKNKKLPEAGPITFCSFSGDPDILYFSETRQKMLSNDI